MAIKHVKVVTTPDDGTSEVGTDEWNDDHTIENNTVTNDHLAGSIAQSKITNLTTDISSKAPIASPTFTGTVVLPNVPAIVTTQLDLKATLGANSFTADQTITEAGIAEIIRFRNQSLDGQFIAKDTYKNLSSTSVERIIAQNIIQTTDYTNGAEDGAQRIYVMENGTLTEYLTIQGAGAKIIAYKPLDMSGTDIDNVQNVIHDISASAGTGMDFSTDQLQTLSRSTTTTFNGSNYATGRSKTLKLLNTSGSTITLGFDSDWTFVGAKPTDLAGNKTAILTLTCFGSTASDVVVGYAVEE